MTVHSLRLLRFEDGDQHSYEMPKEELEADKKKELERLQKMVKEGRTTVPNEEEVDVPAAGETPGEKEKKGDAGESSLREL